MFQRGHELLVVQEVLFLAERRQPLLELLIGQLVAALLPELNEQELVDGFDDQSRRHLGEGFLQLLVVLQRIGSDVLVQSCSQRRDLTLLQIGLGEDVAVHLHQHLLDDLSSNREYERCYEPQTGRDVEFPSHLVHLTCWMRIC